MEKNNRVVVLDDEVNENSALLVILQLLKFDADNKNEPIHFYINSGGGSVDSGMAIYDTINYISAPVYTYCYGIAASMGAFLLSCGEKGHRYSLPRARIMIHQPLVSGGLGAMSETRLKKHADHLKDTRNQLEAILAKNCDKELATLHKDCEEDNWMTAVEAKDYHLIDEII